MFKKIKNLLINKKYMKNPFVDVCGDISSTRIFEASIIITVIIVTFISVLTGKDIGTNVANMLQFITSFVVAGCECKKAVEYYVDKENINNNK